MILNLYSFAAQNARAEFLDQRNRVADAIACDVPIYWICPACHGTADLDDVRDGVAVYRCRHADCPRRTVFVDATERG